MNIYVGLSGGLFQNMFSTHPHSPFNSRQWRTGAFWKVRTALLIPHSPPPPPPTHTSAERPLLNAASPQFFISQSTAIYLLKHTNRSSSFPGELWLMLYFTVWMCVFEEEYLVHVYIRLFVLFQSFISLCCLYFCPSVFCVLHSFWEWDGIHWLL